MVNISGAMSDLGEANETGKTPAACRKMYAKIMKGRELWSPALDAKLKALYRAEREKLWTPIAQQLGKEW